MFQLSERYDSSQARQRQQVMHPARKYTSGVQTKQSKPRLRIAQGRRRRAISIVLRKGAIVRSSARLPCR